MPAVASAVPIINIGPVTPGQGGYLTYYKGEFSTLDTYGKNKAQPVTIDFDGDLSGVADITTGARLTLDNIFHMGTGSLNNGLVEQKTQGGTFSLYSNSSDNSLLLSGNIELGSITGQLGSHEASFQSWQLDITGGSLATNYGSQMVDFRIDMGNTDDCIIISKRCFISSTTAPTGPTGGAIVLDAAGNLKDFRANLVDGFISGKGGTTPPTDVPEPASALLMLLGGALYPVRKRFAKS